MAPSPQVRSLHDCLNPSELRDSLNAAAAARAGSWSIVVPEGDGLATLLSSSGEIGPVEPGVAAALRAVLARTDGRLAPLDGASSSPRAASPLRFRDETYGVFLLDGATDLGWWQEIVDALSPEVVKTQLYETANRESTTSAVKLDALHEAGELVKYVELRVLLTKLMELSVRILRAQVGAIVLVRDGRPATGIEWGLSEEILLALRTGAGEPFLASALERGEPVIIPDAAASPDVDVRDLPVRLRSLVLVPLISQGKRLGAIVVVNAGDDDGPRPEDAEVLRTVANLCAAAVDNAMLYEKTREAERIAAEMGLAAGLQASLLPPPYPANDAFELLGWCMSATETGGDFYDFFDMGQGRTGLVVGDATGHGMRAALAVFIARATLRALLTRSGDLPDIMRTLNDLVERDTEDGRFLTFFFGVFDRRTRVLEYTSAGHDPPFIYRPGDDSLREPRATGIPLGIFPGVPFPTVSVPLEPGDFLVFGTDGIWEAGNRAGELYGKDRLRAAIRAHHALPLAEASERIRRDILEFHDGAERRDDITAVFLRVK